MRILEIELLSDDLESTEKFYAKTIGFTVMRRERSLVSFLTGKSILTFRRSAFLKPVYHFAFNIPSNQLNASKKWISLRTNILPVTEAAEVAEFENWNARAFYFNDNNGNILEYIARFDLDNASHVQFSAGSVCNISEIGIVADVVSTCVSQLGSEYNILPYVKQPVLKNFAALGDANGLIIISAAGRHWYPSQVNAEKFVTRILLLSHGNRVGLIFNGEK
jgi:catechol 2,3-dioxygenase-like lactoylglutathione lyase family enzyme